MCTYMYNICRFNKLVFPHKFLSKFSTSFIVSVKRACINEQVFMQYVMYLDDNDRQPILCF